MTLYSGVWWQLYILGCGGRSPGREERLNGTDAFTYEIYLNPNLASAPVGIEGLSIIRYRNRLSL